jgi:hypothetical protein
MSPDLENFSIAVFPDDFSRGSPVRSQDALVKSARWRIA